MGNGDAKASQTYRQTERCGEPLWQQQASLQTACHNHTESHRGPPTVTEPTTQRIKQTRRLLERRSKEEEEEEEESGVHMSDGDRSRLEVEDTDCDGQT